MNDSHGSGNIITCSTTSLPWIGRDSKDIKDELDKDRSGCDDHKKTGRGFPVLSNIHFVADSAKILPKNRRVLTPLPIR